MILLDSEDIISAIRRSLEAHVLPVLDDDYARTQVDAALVALDEVAHRLRHGDPYLLVNERLESGLVDLIDEIRDQSPVVAEEINATLAAATDIDDPRQRNKILGDELTKVLAGTDPAVSKLRDLLTQDAGQTAGDDSVWMCASAIESLQ
jgi:hypothetical protein